MRAAIILAERQSPPWGNVVGADSTGRRNTSLILLSEDLIEHRDWRCPSERFARPGIHRGSDGGQLIG